MGGYSVTNRIVKPTTSDMSLHTMTVQGYYTVGYRDGRVRVCNVEEMGPILYVLQGKC